MADSSLTNLDYGRPGPSTYDLDRREFTFSRQPTLKNWRQNASWQLVIPAAANLPTTFSANATATRKHARRLTRDHPQLAPTIRQLPDLNAVSGAVASAAASYDPLVGDLLSFGAIFLKKYGTPRRIAALPTGISGNILRLVILGEQRQGWAGDKSVWLNGPTMGDADNGYWNEDAVPIQQVCFAQAQSGNSFLAVRLPSRTAILRPSYHRGRQAAGLSTHYDLPPSVISARPILDITADQTGGVPHADVTFNPNYQFQFGIIDQQYNWSIWQIERRAKREQYSVVRLAGGSVLPVEDTKVDSQDGWAKILWTGSTSTVIVCHRRRVCLIDFSGETFEYLPVPDLVPHRSTDWVLDIKRHPQHQDRFFVLTSSMMFLITVAAPSTADSGSASQYGATIMLSRRHYRGDEDVTLQLSAHMLLNDELCVFLTSRSNQLIQVFYFQDHPSELCESITSSDPVAFDLIAPSAAHITNMHLQPLEYGTQNGLQFRKVNDSAHSYVENELPFYQLVLLSTDLSVHETILVSSVYGPNLEPITWRKTIQTDRGLYSLPYIQEMDDFMVADGLFDWKADPGLKLRTQTPRAVLPSDRPSLEIISDFSQLYRVLVHREDDATPMGSLLEEIQGLISARVVEPGHGHIMDDLNGAIEVSDIDEASENITELFAIDMSSNPYALQYIAPEQTLHIPRSEERSVSALYDSILQDWIAPLPVEVPVPARQAKERLARRVATEVILASARLTHMKSEISSGSGAGSGDTMSLPVLISKPAHVGIVDSITNNNPSSLPTPPPSSVPPSSQPLSSPIFSESRMSYPSDGPLRRLRKHLAISDDSSTPTIIPSSVSELLSHWQPGADPSMYDWEATERALGPEAQDEASQEAQEKERKKREKREKRQRREDELMRARSMKSSQPVFSQPPFPRSSPGPMFGGMAASSQVPGPTSSQVPSQYQGQEGGFVGIRGVHSVVPQSQVEPGRFGGRPDKKKKKGKSRVSGF